MWAKNSLRRCRLYNLAHFLTVAFVVALIAYDFLHGDLSDFSLQQGQIKRIVIVADAPKETEGVERLVMLQVKWSPVSAAILNPSFRFQQKKEAQRILSFRSRRNRIQRIVHALQPSSQSTSPA